MSRWFRFYDDAVNDPKLLRLPDDLYRAWTILLCFASKNSGVLPAADDIAVALRLKPSKVCEWITKLVKSGLIDQTETGFEPHNWNGRQYKSDVSTERVKRFRNGKRNVSETVSETAPETEQIQITETEKKETREVALSSDFEFEDFWKLWPNKVGKPAALKAFVSARKRAGLDAIVDGVFAYIRDKPPDRSWLNPATFLNQNRWEDQPATVSAFNAKPKSAIIQAADDLCRKIASFDGPPREIDELCGDQGEAPPRLLSHG